MTMTQSLPAAAPTEHAAFKAAVKEAVAEALLEQQGLIQEIIIEAFEDIAMAKAIDEGLDSEPVSREEVFKILEGRE